MTHTVPRRLNPLRHHLQDAGLLDLSRRDADRRALFDALFPPGAGVQVQSSSGLHGRLVVYTVSIEDTGDPEQRHDLRLLFGPDGHLQRVTVRIWAQRETWPQPLATGRQLVELLISRRPELARPLPGACRPSWWRAGG